MHRRLLLLALSGLILGSASGAAAAPTNSPEARFVSLINAERAERGVAPLANRTDLDAIAERHAERMRRDAEVYHNRNLASEIPGSWRSAGENVGVGFDVDGLHASFMGSSAHRANILKASFNEIGVGVIVDPSGEVYVTEVFVERAVSSPKPKPKPSTTSSPKTTSKPAAPAPTTDTAPGRTTTAVVGTPSSSSGASAPATRGPRVDRRHAVDVLLRIVSTS